MKAPADKSPEAQRQAAAHEAPQQQDSSDAELQFVDNRMETASLRQLQETAGNSPQAQGLSQFKTIMNSSSRSNAMQSLQAMVDNRPRRASMVSQAGSDDVTVQRVEDEEVLQGEFAAESPAQLAQPSEAKPNNTGLPDNLKAGVESLSGLSLDNVKVHYNSSEPAQLNAHAYAQGTDIHLGPGQEQHLPHEAWHVVQQAQGRVKPTVQMKDGVSVNDDQGLEAEADLIGGKAVQMKGGMHDSRPDPDSLDNLDNRPEAISQRKLFKSVRQDNQTAQLQTLKNNNSSNQKQPVIQRYYNSNNFQMSNTAEFTDQGITKTDFTTTFEQPDTKIHTDYVNLPNIDISGNRGMAIEANASQAKVFYADNQTLADSNQKLAATGVDVRLAHAAGQTLTIPSRDNIEPAKDITKVTPNKPDPLVMGNRVALTGFNDNSCDVVVKNIIGASSRVTVIADNVEKIGDAKAAHQIGGYVANQKGNQEVSTGQGAKEYAPDNMSDTELADRYANVAPNTMGTENQNLKINEGANPDVGEGFLIQSLSNSGTDDIQGSTFQNKQAQLVAIQNLGQAQAEIDIMRQNLANNTKAMMNRWNEHFAGVVAKDGNDVVTLENYNRNVEIGSELQRIFNNLFTQLQEFRDFTWDTVDQEPPTPYMTAQQSAAFINNARAAVQHIDNDEQVINHAYSDALDEAHQTIANVLNLNTVDANNLIYFKMYGAAAQSFHAKWKGTADNPITTRIRSSETEETKSANANLTNCLESMCTILGGASVSPPWATIYGTFATRGNTWDDLKNTQIGNINNFALAKNCNHDITVEFNLWKSDLRQAIADQVKQIVNDQTLADPNSRQELVTMIQLEITNNNYSSFDFSDEGYQKAARYKKLQTLLPTANRL